MAGNDGAAEIRKRLSKYAEDEDLDDACDELKKEKFTSLISLQNGPREVVQQLVRQRMAKGDIVAKLLTELPYNVQDQIKIDNLTPETPMKTVLESIYNCTGEPVSKTMRSKIDSATQTAQHYFDNRKTSELIVRDLPLRVVVVFIWNMENAMAAKQGDSVKSMLAMCKLSDADKSSLVEGFTVANQMSDGELLSHLTGHGSLKSKMALLINQCLRRLKHADFGRDFITSLREAPVDNEMKNLNLQDLFCLLFESLPDLLFLVGLFASNSSRPVPLVYKGFMPNSDHLTTNVVIGAFTKSMIRPYPLVVSVGSAGIGKSTFLNAAWSLGTPEMGPQARSVFHAGSVDLCLDLPKNPRNFHVLDCHGDVNEHVLDALCDCASVLLVQVKSSELQDPELEKRAFWRIAKKYSDRVFLVVRDHVDSALPAAVAQSKFLQKLSVPEFSRLADQDKDQVQVRFRRATVDAMNSSGVKNVTADLWKMVDSLNSKCARIAGVRVVSPSVRHREIAKKVNSFVQNVHSVTASNVFPLSSLKQEQADIVYQYQKLSQANKQNTSAGDDLSRRQTAIESKLNAVTLHPFVSLFLEIVEQNDVAGLLVFVETLNVSIVPVLAPARHKLTQLTRQLFMLTTDKKPDQMNTAEKMEYDRVANEREKLSKEIKAKHVGVELFWREVTFAAGQNLFDMKALTGFVAQMCAYGFQTELVAGESLTVPTTFHGHLAQRLKDKLKQMDALDPSETLIIAVFGPQSSGKSTLLNLLFGCHFLTSDGRCTTGSDFVCLKVENHPKIKRLLLVDTEGLLSADAHNDEFDATMAMFCLSVADVVIINFRSELNRSIKELLEVSLHGLIRLQKAINNGFSPTVFFAQRDFPSGRDTSKLQESIGKLNESLAEIATTVGAGADIAKFFRVDEKKNVVFFPPPFLDNGQWNKEFVNNCSVLREKILDCKPRSQIQTVGGFLDMADANWKALRAPSVQDSIDFKGFADLRQKTKLREESQATENDIYVNVQVKFEAEMNRIKPLAENAVLTGAAGKAALRKLDTDMVVFLNKMCDEQKNVMQQRLDDLDKDGVFKASNKDGELQAFTARLKVRSDTFLKTWQEAFTDHLIKNAKATAENDLSKFLNETFQTSLDQIKQKEAQITRDFESKLRDVLKEYRKEVNEMIVSDFPLVLSEVHSFFTQFNSYRWDPSAVVSMMTLSVGRQIDLKSMNFGTFWKTYLSEFCRGTSLYDRLKTNSKLMSAVLWVTSFFQQNQGKRVASEEVYRAFVDNIVPNIEKLSTNRPFTQSGANEAFNDIINQLVQLEPLWHQCDKQLQYRDITIFNDCIATFCNAWARSLAAARQARADHAVNEFQGLETEYKQEFAKRLKNGFQDVDQADRFVASLCALISTNVFETAKQEVTSQLTTLMMTKTNPNSTRSGPEEYVEKCFLNVFGTPTPDTAAVTQWAQNTASTIRAQCMKDWNSNLATVMNTYNGKMTTECLSLGNGFKTKWLAKLSALTLDGDGFPQDPTPVDANDTPDVRKQKKQAHLKHTLKTLLSGISLTYKLNTTTVTFDFATFSASLDTLLLRIGVIDIWSAFVNQFSQQIAVTPTSLTASLFTALRESVLDYNVGCMHCCPYCHAKCTRDKGHGGNHGTEFHLYQAFGGWRSHGTNWATLRICELTLTGGYYNHQQVLYPSLRAHRDAEHKDWDLPANLQANEATIRNKGHIKGAWEACGQAICNVYGMLFHASYVN